MDTEPRFCVDCGRPAHPGHTISGHAYVRCYACMKARRTSQDRANAARRERDQIRRDCGLVAGRDSTGKRVWE
jgi:hypothetical protein